jgi:hypothetical protein
MSRVVIFNAPKDSGKDFMVERLSDILEHRAFKTELYKNTADYFGVDLDLVIELTSNRHTKEIPHPLFNGKTPRNALIHVSENVYKIEYGQDFYGKALVRSLSNGHYGVSDGGFQSEFDTVVSEVGSENVLLIRMFTQTSTFEGDSRRYIEDHRGCVVYDVFNAKTERDVEYIRGIVTDWLEG